MAAAQTAPAAQRPGADDVAAARSAGAEAPSLVVRAQLNAGMTSEQIRDSAERVLGDRFTSSSPASDAFYAAYDETVAACEADLADASPDGDIEAGLAVDLRGETERGERLREQLLRQAVRHGVADGIAGVSRLQIVDEVYDDEYWSQYRAGLTGWRESEHDGRQAARPQPGRPPTRQQAGEPHPDAAQAAAGWHVSDRGILGRDPAPTAEPQPEVPFGRRMLSEMGMPGGWTQPGPTVTHDYHSERMGALDRQWNEPALGLDHDGPEAG